MSEDDFSGAGEIEMKPPTVNGEVTDMAGVEEALRAGAELLARFIHEDE